MKRYLKLRFFFGLCLVLSLILAHPFAVFADVNHLMINTDSNALMTLELDDSDYLMMSPRSSVGTVSNTVDASMIILTYTNGTFTNYAYIEPSYSSGRFKFNWSIPDYLSGYWISAVRYVLQDKSTNLNGLPRPSGNYNFSFDFSSDFSYDLSPSYAIWESTYKYDNSIYDTVTHNMNTSFLSGDIYVAPTAVNVRSGYYYNRLVTYISQTSMMQNFGGSYAIRFAPTDTEGFSLAGDDISSSEIYEDSVSSSLSDLSSSVDTMTDEISGVTEAIQNLQGAMEPHYSNVLTQLHHITEQLHAFYDQIYNNIHLKEYTLWQDIKTSIENIDLEVNVNLDKLKSSIDNMSTAIQNKLQSVQNAITNGYDNSGINQDAAELDQSLQEYEEAEQTVIDQVNDSLNDFEFDSGFEEYMNTIKVFSDFIQDLYEASGGFKVVINLSLMLSIAGIVIGVYRFRDGG